MKCVFHLIKLKVKEAELRTKEKIENRLCFSRSFSEKVKNLTEKVVGWNWARKYLRTLPPPLWVHILHILHILHIQWVTDMHRLWLDLGRIKNSIGSKLPKQKFGWKDSVFNKVKLFTSWYYQILSLLIASFDWRTKFC